jgi:25S rRNA (adenine2142-N1)-methyltransferase
MREIGFEMVKKRWKQGGKVGYWLFSRRDVGMRTGGFERKKLVNEGGKRNNFAILLRDDGG